MNSFPIAYPLNSSVLEDLALKYKALGDPQRLEILHNICLKKSVCVCDLTDELDISQSKLSYHLKILLNAGLLEKETKGTWSFYSIKQKEMDRLISSQICHVITPSC